MALYCGEERWRRDSGRRTMALLCRGATQCDHTSGEGGGRLRAARGGWLVLVLEQWRLTTNTVKSTTTTKFSIETKWATQ
jgi:hypothetical protein